MIYRFYNYDLIFSFVLNISSKISMQSSGIKTNISTMLAKILGNSDHFYNISLRG